MRPTGTSLRLFRFGRSGLVRLLLLLLRLRSLDVDWRGLDLGLGAGKNSLNAFLVVCDDLFFQFFDPVQLVLILLLQCCGAQLLQLGELTLQACFFLLKQLLGGVHLAVDVSIDLFLSLCSALGSDLRGTGHQYGLRRGLHHQARLLPEYRTRNECKPTDKDRQTHCKSPQQELFRNGP